MITEAQPPEGPVEPTWVTEVLHFWFDEIGEAHWFAKSEDVDSQVRARFLAVHERLVSAGEYDATTQRELLAAVIVVDQFSRNLFRGTPRAYSADPLARRLARTAVARCLDVTMKVQERLFLYMPFQHSEDRADQAPSLELITRLGNEDWMRYAIEHKAIIDRFGRFPHRNAILERHSSADEFALLQDPPDWC